MCRDRGRRCYTGNALEHQELTEGQNSNMAARGVLGSIWISLSGIKGVASRGGLNVPKRINILPQLPAFVNIQTRGIREGEYRSPAFTIAS